MSVYFVKVGQARRLAIISNQDKTLKELESKLASQVDDRSAQSPTDNAQVKTCQLDGLFFVCLPCFNHLTQVDHLLKLHHREVEELNAQIEDARGRQQQQLRDKLEAKKLAKERYQLAATL